MKRNVSTSKGDKLDTKEVIVDSIRQRALCFNIAESEYASAGYILIELVVEIEKKIKVFVAGHQSDSKQFFLLFNIIKDGCARLYADWKEGIEYSQFNQRILDEKKIWDEQLIV
jgi:hypothetical protein